MFLDGVEGRGNQRRWMGGSCLPRGFPRGGSRQLVRYVRKVAACRGRDVLVWRAGMGEVEVGDKNGLVSDCSRLECGERRRRRPISREDCVACLGRPRWLGDA